jgi:hypothetical protein
MKTRCLLFATITLIIISCKKDETQPDNIVFGNMSSTITKSTVRYYDIEDHSVCRVYIPIPTDSSTTIPLDINNDDENDFIIKLSHNYWVPTEYCGHCSIYEYNIIIQGVSSYDYIAMSDQSTTAAYFDNSDIISLDNMWTNEAILILEGGCIRPIFDIENEYIGFKHDKKIGWIKIESSANNGLTVENYAINLTDNNSIIAGQTE